MSTRANSSSTTTPKQMPYSQVIKSIPEEKISNMVYTEQEGATPNWQLDELSYDSIRSTLEKMIGIKRCKPDVKDGMPKDGTAAWIFIIDIPDSNLRIALYKHHVRKMEGSGPGKRIVKTAPVYGVILDTNLSYCFDWRVYTLQDTYERIEYLIHKFTGIRQKIGF